MSHYSSIPEHDFYLEQFCSHHYTFKDLFFAGKTYEREAPPNTPREAQTWRDFSELAKTILDPITDQFGVVKITYGFSGPRLIELIKSRISPELDQHAGSELNSRCKLICKRGGASVDFICPNTQSGLVVEWIARNLKYDRIYFYGDKSPLHVSIGPDMTGIIYELKLNPATGFRIPRKIRLKDLEEIRK